MLFLLALVLVSLALRPGSAPTSAALYPSLTPAPAEPSTVIVGGASAAGAGASKEDNRWTSVASATLGWHEINQASVGSAITAARPCPVRVRCSSLKDGLDDVVLAAPQVVVVAFDPVGPAGAPNEAEVSGYFRALRQAMPDARVIGVGPWAATSRPGAADVALDRSVRASVRSVRGVYISLLDPELVDASMTTARGSALNDIGHQAVSDRVIGALDGTAT